MAADRGKAIAITKLFGLLLFFNCLIEVVEVVVDNGNEAIGLRLNEDRLRC